MSWLAAIIALVALLAWLAAAEWTVNGIERDPLLWEPWCRCSRGLRIALVLLAWPALALAAFVILTRAKRHG